MSTHTLPEPFGRRLTVAEWDALPEDTEGELVDGVLVEEEVPSALHEIVVTWLVATFHAWLRGAGFILGSDAKFAVSPSRGRKPDLSVYLPGSKPPPRSGAVRSPPDIVVEVVSPTPRDTRRDYVEKFSEYAAFGVRHYWLLDPQTRILEINALQDGRYTRALRAADGVVSDVPGCEGLSLDLDALWKKLDELGPEEP